MLIALVPGKRERDALVENALAHGLTTRALRRLLGQRVGPERPATPRAGKLTLASIVSFTTKALEETSGWEFAFARLEKESSTPELETQLVEADELRVTLAPMSAPHRTSAIARLCEELDNRRVRVPGARLFLRLGMTARAPGTFDALQTGHVVRSPCQEVWNHLFPELPPVTSSATAAMSSCRFSRGYALQPGSPSSIDRTRSLTAERPPARKRETTEARSSSASGSALGTSSPSVKSKT